MRQITRAVFLCLTVALISSSLSAQTIINDNGDFSDATVGQTSSITNWDLGGASTYADYEIVNDPDDSNDKVLKVTITDIDGVSNAWDIQPINYVSLQNGNEYKVMFRIKADPQGGGTPTIGFDPGYNSDYTIDVSGDNNKWQTVTVNKFTATSTGSQNLGIHLGKSNNANNDVFYIDDMVVIENPKSATNYVWDFESDAGGWADSEHGSTVSVSSDKADGGSQSIKIVGANDDTEADIRNYSVSNVTEGNTIEFSVWMSSSDQSNLSYLQVEFHGDGFGSYANENIGAHNITGDQWSTVSTTVPAIGSPPLNAMDIKAVVGSASNTPTIYIDNINVKSSVHSSIINGTEGWRMLSSPVSGKAYTDILDNIWTQGSSNADATNGTANVQTYDGSSFSGVSDLSSTMSPGQGFITYVYNDDNYDGNPDGFPKALQVIGTENSGSVSPSLNSGADTWSLVGNPYATTIDWDNLGKTELTGTVYTYDHRIPGYISWNGSTGALNEGLIAPFQGFWVQNTSGASSPSLTIEEADQSSGGKLYKPRNEAPAMEVKAEMGNLYNHAYFSFTSSGETGLDSRDAVKLQPLDHQNYLSVATKADDKKLDINNLPADLEQRVDIPMSVKVYEAVESGWSAKSGEVTLSWPMLRNVPESWDITLNDEKTGEEIDVRQTSSYTFVAEGSEEVTLEKAVSQSGPVMQADTSDGSRFTFTFNPNKATSIGSSNRPEKFELDQNYPNPFNPATTIGYTIASQSDVELSIYNVMGQKVTTLVNESKSPGSYNVQWNAEGRSSGIYYYQLRAGEKVITRQMTLIK